MPVNERDLKITLSAVTGDLTSGLNRAKSEIRSFGQSATAELDKVAERGEKMKNIFKDMVEAFIGFEIVDGLKKIAEAANAASDSLEIAAQITKNLGKDFDVENVDTWLRKLAASAKGGGFAISEMRAAMQQLSSTGASQIQQERLLVDVLGLAAARHISVAEATHIALMAAEGHTEALSRFGIQVKDAAGNLLSYTQIMSNWEKTVGGAAEDRANRLDGAFGQLTNSVNRLSVAFGQGLIPYFTGAANAAGALANAVAQLPTPLLAAGAGLTFVTLGLTALGLIIPGVVKLFSFFTGGLMLLVDLVGPAVAGIRSLITWMSLLNTALAETAIAEWAALAPITALVVAVGLLVGLVVEAVRGFQDLKTAWTWISGIVFPKLPDIKTPKANLDGLGGPDKGAQKGINDWITQQKEQILAAVRAATEALDMAQARLAATTGKLEALRDKRDPRALLTGGNVGEEQAIVNEQLQRERDLREKVGQQQQAEIVASRQLSALAAALPTGDKERVKHASDIRTEAEKHLIAAIKLGGEYDKMQGAVAKLVLELMKIPLQLAKQAEQLASIAANLLFGQQSEGARSTAAQAATAFERQHVFRPATPVEQAQQTAQGARDDLDQKQRELAKAEADRIALEKKITAELVPAVEAAQLRADADLKIEQATNAATEALKKLGLETARVNEAQRERATRDRSEVLNATLGKVPGVTTTATGGLGAFNFGAVFAQAIAQSKTFADIMQLVNEIMGVFTEIFDELEPVVDALLHVIASIVNIFIALWNVITRIVGLFGIHIAQLQQINTDFGQATTNLVTFFHDIPTLNELASGKTGGLTAETTNDPLWQIHEDLTNTGSPLATWLKDIVIAIGAIFLGSLLPGSIGTFFDGLKSDLGNWWNKLTANIPPNLKSAFDDFALGIGEIYLGLDLINNHTGGILGFLEKLVGYLMVFEGAANVINGIGQIFNSGSNLIKLPGLLKPIVNAAGGGAGVGGAALNTAGMSAGDVAAIYEGAASAGISGAAAGAAAAASAAAGGATAAEAAAAAHAAAAQVLPSLIASDTGMATGLGGASGFSATGVEGASDIAYSGGGGGAAAGGGASSFIAGLAPALGAAALAFFYINGGFGGMAPHNISTTPATMQSGANLTGETTVIPNASGPGLYTGGLAPGQSYAPAASYSTMYGSSGVASGAIAQALTLIQQPLSSFSAALQPIVQQLQTMAQQALTQLNANTQTLTGYDTDGMPIYATGGGTSTMGGADFLSEFMTMFDPGGNNMNSTLSDDVTQLVQAMQDNLSASTSGLPGTTINPSNMRYASTAMDSTGGTATIQINQTFNGDINGAGDVQDIGNSLGDSVIQAMTTNRYQTTRIAL